MLRLSELSGFIVCGSLYGKNYGKISAENRNRKHFSKSFKGRGFLVSGWVWAIYI